jgi:uncharacterized protein YegJ (DUF2314 family)
METFDGYPVRKGFAGPDWRLEDCAVRSKESPDTFEAPSEDEQSLVKVGSLLRLHFMITDPELMADSQNPRAERMWVEVCDAIREGVFRGHLTNEPAFIQSLNQGDVIEFKWAHVAQVLVTT